MVDLMQGSIWFESDPSIRPGTTAVVLLPLPLCNDSSIRDNSDSFHVNNDGSVVKTGDGNNSSTTTAGSSLSDADSNRLIEEPISILIVDDVKMNRAILKRRIQKCIAPNCIVHEAATGEEAIAMCCEPSEETGDPPPHFDVLIVDQYMEEAGGVMVGTDAIFALRRSKVGSVIIGNSGNDLDNKFYQAGADLFCKKPLPSNPEIIRQLRVALQLDDRVGAESLMAGSIPNHNSASLSRDSSQSTRLSADSTDINV